MRASVCVQADCCDTTESVTNQLEKHRRDVPSALLRRGWRREGGAVGSSIGRHAGGSSRELARGGTSAQPVATQQQELWRELGRLQSASSPSHAEMNVPEQGPIGWEALAT